MQFLIIAFLLTLEVISGLHIKCEVIVTFIYIRRNNLEAKTCRMNNYTAIETTRVSLNENLDQEMKDLFFQTNEKIFFLPINVHKSFSKSGTYLSI